MNDLTIEDLKNPRLADEVFRKQGILRVPFTTVHASIGNMISGYTADYLDIVDYEVLMDAIRKYPREMDTASSYLYVFTVKHYELFLQMIALENVMKDGKMEYTSEHKVLYTDQTGGGYEGCPTFSSGDEEVFQNIKSTKYRRAFASDCLHLVKLVTTSMIMGGKSETLAEYSLYIPYQD